MTWPYRPVFSVLLWSLLVISPIYAQPITFSDPVGLLTNDGSITIGSGSDDPVTLTFDADGGTDGTLSWSGASDQFSIAGGDVLLADGELIVEDSSGTIFDVTNPSSTRGRLRLYDGGQVFIDLTGQQNVDSYIRTGTTGGFSVGKVSATERFSVASEAAADTFLDIRNDDDIANYEGVQIGIDDTNNDVEITAITDGLGDDNLDIVLTPAGTGTVNISDVLDLVGRSAAPTGVAGRMYYDTDSNELCIYNGSAWTGLIAAGACT